MKLFRTNFLFDQALLTQDQRIKFPLRIDANGADREVFQRLQTVEADIENFVNSGSCAYIYSEITGNGKTSWAIRLISAYLQKIWFKSDLCCRALFVSVPRFFIALKDSISNENPYAKHVISNVLKADLVVFDDVGTKSLTEFEGEHLLNIINTRLDDKKSNVYTSNLNTMTLQAVVGDRLYSRIVNYSSLFHLVGSDKRSLLK